ncbi:sigma-54-dependent Fis family transcriptional regulator [Acetobacterium malicum]|uniref:sigma-54-dependent Fis family transcriptional regulator n=1 Tax=Acetobacterium malicum TaxID=52692 RepID=UPI00042671D0|nr:sigma 54-interacting transcriptional regulator [Acetobacterium dehalogenans]
MIDNQKELAKYRDHFFQTGVIHHLVRKEIAEGWKRCRENGVDRIFGLGVEVDTETFAEILEYNREFIRVSEIVLQQAYHSVANSDAIIFITDAKGCILAQYKDSSTSVPTNETCLLPGYIWREDVNGMTSMDLAMRLDKPVRIVGAEHYCINQEICAGSSAPIHDETGKILGSLNLITLIGQYSKHSLGIVTAGAALIENHLQLEQTLRLFKTTFNTMSEGMILIDQNYEIEEMNASAKKILDLSDQSLHYFDIRKALRFDSFDNFLHKKEKELVFHLDRRTVYCIGDVDIVELRQNRIFYSIVFKAAKTVNKMINKMTGNAAIYAFEDIITADKKMLDLITYAKKIAPIDCSVLILGPSGTGKELFAHAVHNNSPRSKGPFIAINCAALPPDLVESEIFGYEPGAFTGAKQGGQTGKIELADGGTLFLDEVGELPLNIQSKLLRVLDNHRITRLGGKMEKEIDVRIITATNRNLEDEIKNKNFRLDLFYRINTFTLVIPPLCERKGDVVLLSQYFLQKLNRERDNQIYSIDPAVISAFQDFDWPGNVRQLQNVMMRSFYVCETTKLSLEDLPDTVKGLKHREVTNLLAVSSTMQDAERDIILKAIESCGGNMTAAAQQLKIAKSTLYRKIKRYHIIVEKTFRNH